MKADQQQHAAIGQGLLYHWAFLHRGKVVDFIARNWEEAGFEVGNQGEPIATKTGDTVAMFEVQQFDPDNQLHCETWDRSQKRSTCS